MKLDTQKPWVLINAPVTSYKLNAMGEYVNGIKNLTYPNIAILLTDNSETDDMYNAMIPVEKEFLKKGINFSIVMTPHRVFVRERLVEGRNLARAVLTKQQDLSSFEMKLIDQKKVRELQKMDFDYVFTLEQDVIPPADVIEKLMALQKDAVSGIYMNTKVYVDQNTKAQQVIFIPMIWNYGHPGVTEMEVLNDTNLDFMFPSRVQECAAAGVGCELVTKDAWTKSFHNEDYFPMYDQAIADYLVMNPNSNIAQIDEGLKNFEANLKERNETNTKGCEVNEIKALYQYSLNGQSHEIELIKERKTFGFRYDMRKFACDDMFFSMDLHNSGFKLWFDSHIFCRHLHQMWDTVVMGER